MKHDMTRRNALKFAAATSALAAVPVHATPQNPPPLNPPTKPDGEALNAKALRTDRDFVIAAGMTEAEADCWETIAKAAGQFFSLPEQHPMDAAEMASAIHVVQNKLLSRPTYRRYLELAKAARGAHP